MIYYFYLHFIKYGKVKGAPFEERIFWKIACSKEREYKGDYSAGKGKEGKWAQWTHSSSSSSSLAVRAFSVPKFNC